MHSKKFDVVGLGQCCLDFIGKIEKYPAVDQKCEMSALTVQGGGPVATALTALSRWKKSCAFMGQIGDDHFGADIRLSLVEEGIDTGGLKIRRQSNSQVAFIATESDSGRRNIFWQRPDGSALSSAEIDYKAIANARVFHTDGLFAEAAVEASRTAASAGVPVVVDAGTLRPGLLDLAPHTDFFIASESFAQALVGRHAPLEACRELLAMGAAFACVTLGARGYLAVDRDDIIERPAYPVTAVDTTGCGDVFHAGFIYGLLEHWPVAARLDFAAWAAAMVSLHPGGRAGIPRASAWPGKPV